MYVDARVLTVRQPHASLIVRGVKVIEQRTWATKYRGLVLIHAGKVAEPGGEHLPRGVIVGHVALTATRIYVWLNAASEFGRMLGLVDPEEFTDRRNSAVDQNVLARKTRYVARGAAD